MLDRLAQLALFALALPFFILGAVAFLIGATIDSLGDL